MYLLCWIPVEESVEQISMHLEDRFSEEREGTFNGSARSMGRHRFDKIIEWGIDFVLYFQIWLTTKQVSFFPIQEHGIIGQIHSLDFSSLSIAISPLSLPHPGLFVEDIFLRVILMNLPVKEERNSFLLYVIPIITPVTTQSLFPWWRNSSLRTY